MAKKAKGILRTQAEKDALKIATGRPSKYDPIVIQKFLDYFERPPYTVKDDGKIEVADMPTLAGFSISIGIDRDTLKEWAKEYPDFSAVYKKAAAYQENYLMVNGSKGLIQQPIAIFALKNYSGMTDKKEVEHKGEVKNTITVQPFDIEERKKQLKDVNE